MFGDLVWFVTEFVKQTSSCGWSEEETGGDGEVSLDNESAIDKSPPVIWLGEGGALLKYNLIFKLSYEIIIIIFKSSIFRYNWFYIIP